MAHEFNMRNKLKTEERQTSRGPTKDQNLKTSQREYKIATGRQVLSAVTNLISDNTSNKSIRFATLHDFYQLKRLHEQN